MSDNKLLKVILGGAVVGAAAAAAIAYKKQCDEFSAELEDDEDEEESEDSETERSYSDISLDEEEPTEDNKLVTEE